MSEEKTRRRGRSAFTALALAGAICGCSGDPGAAGGSGTGVIPDKVGHVFIIVLENESYDASFGATSPAPYLSKDLPAMGQLLTHYYATSHHSLSNYITMISGESPTVATQADCPSYADFSGTMTPDESSGQVTGSGCIYPTAIKTIADQLQVAGLSWKGYMEDMGNDPVRDGGTARAAGGTTCAHPTPNTPDGTQKAQGPPLTLDQYGVRHNPFMYFHSIIDDQTTCDAHDVPLSQLELDLADVATTPNYAFIVPNLCNDGHDPDSTTDPSGTTCADGSTTIKLAAIDNWLKVWVPKILASPAFKQDGLLIVTFDEAAGSDTTACCAEQPGPNTPSPGGESNGPGGGVVGAVLISPLIKPGTTNDADYNHYAMLRSIEDIFGLSHLGFAAQTGLKPFGADVFNNTNP